ncbi:hypothetical protein K1F50_08005 [Muricauda oceani]|uniref:Uncharacterized protein n=1 Tax=Flagellimonas oceani TaxID=2698672 RepID=A0A6G7J4W5_9FLAO|nr:hypothetical protein [Allomuricauda oceani]MBW8242742.1 hypothetical protein [Allomuricauda oceani]QII45522.1 hypothetical protein GVT53_12810 [Allomuricauda oceani]
MKNTYAIRMFIVGCALGTFGLFAQDMEHPKFGSGFYPTDVYSLTQSIWADMDEESLMLLEDYTKSTIYLVKENDTLVPVLDQYASDVQDSSLDLSVNDLPNIQGVKRIILVEDYYTFCCLSISLNYIIETTEGRFVHLPELKVENCGEEFNYWQYRFPNEMFGVPGKIVLGYLDLSQAYEVRSFQEEKVFLWDGEKLIREQ